MHTFSILWLNLLLTEFMQINNVLDLHAVLTCVGKNQYLIFHFYLSTIHQICLSNYDSYEQFLNLALNEHSEGF